jgi:hypothetical protein
MSDGSPAGTSGDFIVCKSEPRAMTGVNTARALRPASTASAASVCAIARCSGGIDAATDARSPSASRRSYSPISPAS